MRGWQIAVRTLRLTVLAAFLNAPVAARELHWAGLEVDATLETDGTLAISELQQMVFTGDWNGGERSFRLFPGQELDVRRVVRIDPTTGRERDLVRGDLDQLDHWDRTSSSVVRWRSRLPSDPEFEATRIDYRIDYRLTGALQKLGDRRYKLEHDFAFADRAGVIERVVVRLTLGPGWKATSAHPVSWETGALTPGEQFVVPVELEFEGAAGVALPAKAAPPRLSQEFRGGAVAVFIAGVLWFVARFVRRDAALGRFGGSAAIAIDRAWLDEKVFSLRPEVVGAAWDRSVGSAEVAALLARLTAEGKLASEVKTSGWFIFKNHDLHLKLLVPREELGDYERALIDALFGGATVTDTKTLRNRYRSTGFDPASKIKQGVEARLAATRGFAEGSPKPKWQPTALLFVAGLTAMIAAFALHTASRGVVVFSLFVLIFPWLFLGLVPALRGQAQVRLSGTFVALFLSMGLLGAWIWFIGGLTGTSWLAVVGVGTLALALARTTFNILSTRESAEGLIRRRELERARDYFERELRKDQPQLEDRWFPYLLALGLAPDVDKWFRRFGGATGATSMRTSPGSFSTGGGSSSGGSSWTGGGGSFGGAGASATWAMAATAMSAGVSKPGSSSSGGGGGGGSSGGGGGGGW